MGSRRIERHRCRECGAEHPKWAGQCAVCHRWNCLEPLADEPDRSRAARAAAPVRLDDPHAPPPARPQATSIAELDTVLGGGLVPGSVTLLGGAPGIGKSTLMLQLLAAWDGPTMYIAAEESAEQIRDRAERLAIDRSSIWVHATTSVGSAIEAIRAQCPGDRRPAELVVVDSIQTVADPDLGGVAGGVAQVRACAQRLVDVAKASHVAIVLIGHITKDGSLAGPSTLEHVVDTVLHFEGDHHHALRQLRASKHRFGPTNELGVFEMTPHGLEAVDDPSAVLLADRRPGIPGSVIVPTVEGRRAVVVEIQALTNPTPPGASARRSAQGLDSRRLAMLLAVLERRARVGLGDLDVYASAAGGLRLTEPGCDLGVAVAVASARLDAPVSSRVAVFGEVGLGGEVRQVPGLERRIDEARRLECTRIIVPATALGASPGNDIIGVNTVAQGLAAAGVTDDVHALRAV
ncbi:MAG: DNA repair protein RadA [Actinomycetota bacterium]